MIHNDGDANADVHTGATAAAAPVNATNAKRRETSGEVHGWRFFCRIEPAMSSEERESLARELHLKPHMSPPEVVFAGNRVVLQHAQSGLTIQFKAATALRMWAQAHVNQDVYADHSSFDYTYRTDYNGSVAVEKMPATVTTKRQYISVLGVTTSETLPLDKLMQHVKILYYDRVILFEDDVRDLGEIYLEAKIRVMDFGFLVLFRYYCRVDGKFVRFVDTRYYHEFGSSFIWRDHEVRESTIPELHKRMYPSASRTSDENHQDDNHHHHHHHHSLDFSADAVYPALSASSSKTEKIPLPVQPSATCK